MALHRYQIDDAIELIPQRFSPRDAQGHYTVTRLLPNDSPDRKYRVRSGRDGQERVVRESEVRLSSTNMFGRTMPSPA